jgi:predicted metal-dependent hydrolase
MGIIFTTEQMTLEADLLKLPKELGEFVIVHELIYLLVPNHGRVFISFMQVYLPEWETLETQLQIYIWKEPKKKR